MYGKLTDQNIKQIFKQAGLDDISKIQKSKVGFSNDVYFINDTYVLKAGKSEDDKKSLKRELYFCNLFRGKLPAPVVITADLAGESVDRPYIIYKKIEGNNLYNHWHELTNEQRRRLVQQICSFLKTINEESTDDFIDKFQIDTTTSWQNNIVSQIEKHLAKAISQGLVEENVVVKVRKFVNERKSVLNEAKMALTYFDVHFDNFLIADKQITGMLDFERTDYLSIDYVLDVVKRMVEYPDKYASDEAEQYIKSADYADLYKWYQEFYPELFEFRDLETRLDLYAVRYILKMHWLFPNDNRARKELAIILGEN